MQEVLIFLTIVVGGSFSAALFTIAIRLWRADEAEYELNRRCLRDCRWTELLEGRLWRGDRGMRDGRLTAGIAIDRRTNKWVLQGRFSDEAIANVLRRPSQ